MRNDTSQKMLTVAQLIEILKELPQDYSLYMDSDDGLGNYLMSEAVSVRIDKEKSVVIIEQGD